MSEPSQTTYERSPGIPLETLGDVRRAMANLLRDMKADRIDIRLGNALVFGYTQLACLYRDRRDSLFQKQVVNRIQALEKQREVQEQPAPAAEH